MSRKVNNKQSNKRNLIAHHDPKSPISEQYRTIRTNIEFASIDQKVSTILVTSSGAMEGKSTTASNLAVVMAQQGNRVLLIDADLRKPTAHYTFSVPNLVGLTSMLTKQHTADEAIQATEVPNLSILSSGPIPPNPAELLSSRAMSLLLEKLAEIYDVIILDSPPLLAVADAQILANHTDGTILVVSSGKTDREQAVKAKDLLVAAKAKVLGVVLNAKELKEGQYYYYYGG
ncbi:CpsD/CapB family tyrosine-protein kinase [Alkalihalobacterium elongatum]|uniref:CpsD/CapB family tyrosine-protein kinase n=1 Tax=Alkalihalobacterium elongatum TaxID=2675466 RepID=UPI001C1F5092|nr:CpsD/CapB family tyrosine-protein kinase [Alkalihalobacterium elongatum]